MSADLMSREIAARLTDRESRRVRRFDRAADALLASVLGILAAAALVHWWAS